MGREVRPSEMMMKHLWVIERSGLSQIIYPKNLYVLEGLQRRDPHADDVFLPYNTNWDLNWHFSQW